MYVCLKLNKTAGMCILDSVMFVYDNRDLFVDCDMKHDYDTRHKSNLVPEKYNFTYLKKNVKYCIIKNFNSFPESIRNLPKNEMCIKKNFKPVTPF